MRAILTRESEILEFYPGTTKPLAPPELVAQCERRGNRLFAPVGTIIDDPDCWVLVMQCVAVADDDECREKTLRTAEQQAIADHAAKRLSAGIHPEDFEKYDRGEIVGYDSSGKYIRGPSWVEANNDNEEDE